MTSSKPPALATWMLEHLTTGGTNEALAGDLLEEYQQRRSATWYWHQVLGAIVASFFSELRAGWTMLWAITFVLVWVYGVHLFFVFVHPFRLGTPSQVWLQMHGGEAIPLTLVTLMIVAVPLGIHLAVQQSLHLREFALGFGVGALVMFTLRLLTLDGLMLLLAPLARHGVSRYWLSVSFRWYLAYVYPTVPLIAAMWGARMVRKKTRATATQPLLSRQPVGGRVRGAGEISAGSHLLRF